MPVSWCRANTSEKNAKKKEMTDVISVFRYHASAPKNSPEECLPIGTL